MSQSDAASPNVQEHATSPHVRGVLPTWSMAFALSLCLVMIAGLLVMILAQGAATFWPKPIDRITLESGEVVIGVPSRETTGPDGEARRLYRVGNRDLGSRPFVWIDLDNVAASERDPALVLVEREQWGVFVGTFDGLAGAGGEVSASFDELERAIEAGRDRRRAMDRLRSGPIADINAEIEDTRRAIAAARFTASDPETGGLPGSVWGIVVAGAISVGVGGVVCLRRGMRIGRAGLVAAGLLGAVAVLERPLPPAAEQIAAAEATIESLTVKQAELADRFAALSAELRALEAADSVYRVRFVSADGVFAPESQGMPDTPMRVSQVVRVVRPNGQSPAEAFGVYLSRWAEFLRADPREANTEGGVFPVIIGTVVVTMLLTVAVVPLGVMAALYIREYANQGLIISVLRIAINNLAGVPSIVYGVFGLGFFCYTVGGFIDVGPADAVTLPNPVWWIVGVLAASAIAGALVLAASNEKARWKTLVGVLWFAAITAVLVLLATSPYFDGFFRFKMLDGEPTFGSSGMLWASLTLALLTLPVVIVSTEEAIAAVPPSLREGSYGCGASRWQTIRRVVMPGALPGVMTGTILAVARGAGEVAPLMVVGAVKLAPDLPVDDRFPFIFLDRSFMHLGFHIFDLGFQSPDSEAARGMVWTTTLILIVLVVAMNLAAIMLRNRLRRRLAGGHF